MAYWPAPTIWPHRSARWPHVYGRQSFGRLDTPAGPVTSLGMRCETAPTVGPRSMVRRSCAGAAGLARNGRCCLGQPVLKEALSGLGLREVERAAVRVAGLTGPAGAAMARFISTIGEPACRAR